MLVTKGFVSTGYQAHSSQGSLRTLCGTLCTWDVVCGGVPAVPGVSFCPLSLDLDERFRVYALQVQIWRIPPLVGDKKHDVTVLNVHRCFSQFCCFSSCRMSCVLSAPVGPFPRREEFCAVCLGRISNIKATNIFCNFDQRFVCHCQIWPSFSGPFVLSTCFGL